MKKETFSCEAYVGRWADGSIGWCAPRHLWPGRVPASYSAANYSEGEEAFLCKITVEPLPMARRVFFRCDDHGVEEQRKAIRNGGA